MCINTLGLVMFMIIRAPFSFEIKDEEIKVLILR
jgi:hypothetical protein